MIYSQPLLCDFHIHSDMSDGKMSIEQIVDFYGSKGFGAIAITDHLCEDNTLIGQVSHYLKKSLSEKSFSEYLWRIEFAKKQAWDKYKMIVIPGVEFTKNTVSNSRSAHFIGLGIEEWISPNMESIELLALLKRKRLTTIAAHPVSTRVWEKQTYFLWDQRDKLHDLIDLWEVASGAIMFPEVVQSGLPMIANSDLHHPKQINSWKTIVYSDKEPKSILKNIKEQNLQFHFFTEPLMKQEWILANA